MGLFHGRVKSSAPNHDSNPNKIHLVQFYLAQIYLAQICLAQICLAQIYLALGGTGSAHYAVNHLTAE
jgi:hypothetical protein